MGHYQSHLISSRHRHGKSSLVFSSVQHEIVNVNVGVGVDVCVVHKRETDSGQDELVLGPARYLFPWPSTGPRGANHVLQVCCVDLNRTKYTYRSMAARTIGVACRRYCTEADAGSVMPPRARMLGLVTLSLFHPFTLHPVLCIPWNSRPLVLHSVESWSVTRKGLPQWEGELLGMSATGKTLL